MPVPALPVPPPRAARVLTAVRREYFDLLMRPMRGTLMLTAKEDHRTGEATISRAPVKAQVIEGILELALPPGVYALRGTLYTADEEQSAVAEEFELEGEL